MKIIQQYAYDAWEDNRSRLEASDQKSHIAQYRPKAYLGNSHLKLLKAFLKPKFIRAFSQKFSKRLEVNRSEICYGGLPKELEGFQILHLSDFPCCCFASPIPQNNKEKSQ